MNDHAAPRSLVRRLLRLFVRVTLALLGFALVFPLLWRALAPTRLPVAPALVAPTAGMYEVYVVDWGYHTAIVVPQPASVDWRLGPPGRETAPWIEYAWGDRRFYRDGDFRPHSVFATLVLPTEAVAYVAGRDRPPSIADGARAVHVRTVDAATLGALAAELERTVVRDESGRRREPTPPVAGYRGRFYAATGRYLWTQDCNAWTVERLAAAGLARRGAFVVFSGQVAPRLVGFRPADQRAIPAGSPSTSRPR
jgi:hypothetical protein